MDVEHLWFSQTGGGGGDPPAISGGGPGDVEDDPLVQTLANMADKRLYKLVKWCKSLPLFKNIVVSRRNLNTVCVHQKEGTKYPDRVVSTPLFKKIFQFSWGFICRLTIKSPC